jgi:hypothetical protein
MLDYLMGDVPLSKEKVAYKLAGVRKRLDVELKVKAGTEKMAQAMRGSGGKRMQEVEEKMRECGGKVGVLQKAELKYKNLMIGSVEVVDDKGN